MDKAPPTPAEPPSSSPESKVRTNDYVSVECERTPCSQCPRTADECGCECHTPTPAEPPSLPASEAQRFDAAAYARYVADELYATGPKADALRAFADEIENRDDYKRSKAASSAPGAVQQEREEALRRLHNQGHGPNGPPRCRKCEQVRAILASEGEAARPSSAAGSPGDA